MICCGPSPIAASCRTRSIATPQQWQDTPVLLGCERAAAADLRPAAQSGQRSTGRRRARRPHRRDHRRRGAAAARRAQPLSSLPRPGTRARDAQHRGRRNALGLVAKPYNCGVSRPASFPDGKSLLARRDRTASVSALGGSRLFRPAAGARSYCIVIPPPNVTGTLHMGHAFQDTIMDALIRHASHARRCRLCGSRAPITPASPPRWWSSASSTPEGKRRTDLSREAFVERVWAWKEQSGGTIVAADAPPRRLGGLVARALHMDPGSVAAR